MDKSKLQVEAWSFSIPGNPAWRRPQGRRSAGMNGAWSEAEVFAFKRIFVILKESELTEESLMFTDQEILRYAQNDKNVFE